jgi:predicted amidohydrolase YtcJ
MAAAYRRRLRAVILENGPVYTADLRLPRVRALALAGGVVAGGADVREGDEDTVGGERIDLDGRCVVPGFSDSHVHFLSWAEDRRQLDLGGCASRAEALTTVAAEAAGEGWLRGRGWRSALWPDAEPDAASLDAVTGERPAALWAHDGHTLWVNSAALRAAGAGPATGVLHEWEAWRFSLPEPDAAQQRRWVREAMAAANARGVVAVHDLQRSGGRDIWQRLDADRRLTLRVLMCPPLEQLDAARALELRGGFGSELLRVGPLKGFMDGTLGSETAWMLDGSGEQLLSCEELEQAIPEAAAGGLAVTVHAIGDGANRAALDAFAATREVWQGAILRPRIEHAQCLDDADVGRFAELGVIASVQPSHATSDRDVADRLWGERARCAYRFADLAASGATLILGSDAPVEDLDPLAGFAAAVARTADERPAWHPEQRLSPEAALHGFTAAPAYAAGEERRRGRLMPGLAADLVVLDRDIVARPQEAASAQVVATMLGGRWVHGAPPW